MKSHENSYLLTYRDVAEILGLKENTLRVWVSSGKIPHVKLGSAVRFTPDMVQQIIAQSTREALT